MDTVTVCVCTVHTHTQVVASMKMMYRRRFIVTTILLHIIFFSFQYGYLGTQMWFPEVFQELHINNSVEIFPFPADSIATTNSFYQDTLFVTLASLLSNVVQIVIIDFFGAKALAGTCSLSTSHCAHTVKFPFLTSDCSSVVLCAPFFTLGGSALLADSGVGNDVQPSRRRSQHLSLHIHYKLLSYRIPVHTDIIMQNSLSLSLHQHGLKFAGLQAWEFSSRWAGLVPVWPTLPWGTCLVFTSFHC